MAEQGSTTNGPDWSWRATDTGWPPADNRIHDLEQQLASLRDQLAARDDELAGRPNALWPKWIGELQGQLAEAEQRVKMLETALRAAEWTSHSEELAADGAHCGVCLASIAEGHSTDCQVAAALTPTSEEPKDG